MTLPSRQSESRDLLSELHDEQCAHGATLRRLDRGEEELTRLRTAMEHARSALEVDQYGEAWMALNTELNA